MLPQHQGVPGAEVWEARRGQGYSDDQIRADLQAEGAPEALWAQEIQRDKLGTSADNPIELATVDRNKLLAQNPTGAWVRQPGGEPYFVEPGGI
jgi:hypothetical protein